MTSLFNYFVRLPAIRSVLPVLLGVLPVILGVLPVILSVLPVILSEAKNLFFHPHQILHSACGSVYGDNEMFRMTMAGLLQGGCQVSYEIIHILYADRQSEHIRIDSCSDLLFRTEL